jgi:hypothetical protein
MPYEVVRVSPRCWQVINTKTKKVKAKCSTKKNAEAQVRLLMDLEQGKTKGGATIEERGLAGETRLKYNIDISPKFTIGKQSHAPRMILNNIVHQVDGLPLARVDSFCGATHPRHNIKKTGIQEKPFSKVQSQ